jgi:cell wall-associated NlpC family hydrolase
MKRIHALVLGLALVAATPGFATADPSTRPAGHQQAVDSVIARALAQRGVPYTYGGGNASGPSQRPASVPLPSAVVPDAVVPGAVVPEAATGLRLAPTLTPPALSTPGFATPGLQSAPGLDPSANVVGFDASGLIVYAYAGVGLKLPRSSGEQYKVGWKVTPDQALPGDLIFYGPDGTKSVAMFLGNGQMLEATDPVVKVSPVRTNGMAPYLARIIS